MKTYVNTRHGPVLVFANCRVKIFDAIRATEPAQINDHHSLYLKPADFNPGDWATLTPDEQMTSALAALDEARTDLAKERDRKMCWMTATGALAATLVALFLSP